jgi:hypothetical protein
VNRQEAELQVRSIEDAGIDHGTDFEGRNVIDIHEVVPADSDRVTGRFIPVRQILRSTDMRADAPESMTYDVSSPM